MMDGGEPMSGAVCRTCGRRLTLAEFRACAGVGHFCSTHRPYAKPLPTRPAPRPRPSGPKPPGSRRGRRLSEHGMVEYSCTAQFARNGVTRRGRLTADHPSSIGGSLVFVSNGLGYGPGEIATLFIKDPEGRAAAERAGFTCHH